jgi:hypothetical protein
MAKPGIGEGRTGHSYAIPTKNEGLTTLPLRRIQQYVDSFLIYARLHPKLQFKCVAIGCGLAGYSAESIAPMFADAPANVQLPDEFKKVLGR